MLILKKGKVELKNVPVDSQNNHVLNVNSAWVVKDLSIPLKHKNLQEVSFPEVERKKLFILLSNTQEVFIAFDARRNKANDLFAIKSCLG